MKQHIVLIEVDEPFGGLLGEALEADVVSVSLEEFATLDYETITTVVTASQPLGHRAREAGWTGRLVIICARDQGLPRGAIHVRRGAIDTTLEELRSAVRAPSSIEDLDHQLRAAWRDFQASLPRRVESLAQSLYADTPDLATALDHAQRLKNTASSFGASSVAISVQRLIGSLSHLQSTENPPPRDWQDVFEGVENVRAKAELLDVSTTLNPISTAGVADTSLLVVDDDDKARESLVSLASRLGIHIHQATSAEEAEKVASRLRLDGALVDLYLARGDGLSVGRQLRERGIPIAYASIRPNFTSRLGAVSTRGHRYLEKPIGVLDLAALADELKASRRLERPTVVIVEPLADVPNTTLYCLDEAGWDVHRLPDPLEMLEHLVAIQPDAVILDLALPWVDAMDVCRVIRTSMRWSHLPVIGMTDEAGRHTRMRALEAGFDDILVKRMSPEEMVMRVRMRAHREVKRRSRLAVEPSTGLPNRRHTLLALSELFEDAMRHRRPVSVGLVAVANLGSLGQTRGLLAAERCTHTLGTMLRHGLRPLDVVGHWDQATFAVGLLDATRKGADAVMRRFLDPFSRIAFRDRDEKVFRARIKARVATWPETSKNIDELLVTLMSELDP